jgi:DNA invertase Pin-like site-specific DNA recombinase/transposase-like protein
MMVISKFRKIFKEEMMRTGKPERIILDLNNLRKPFGFIIFLGRFCLRRIILSYFSTYFYWENLFYHTFLMVLLLFILGGTFSSYFFSLPLFLVLGTNVNGSLTPFLEERRSEEVVKKEKDTYHMEEFEDGKGVKAAAYIRVSTGKQVLGFSLAAQTEALRELARKRGVSSLYWFRDAGESGRDFDKRQLDEILQLAATREITELLVVDIDRIGRISRKLMDFLLDLRDYGVIIVEPSGEMDVNELTGLMMAAIKSWAAQYENERRALASVSGRVQAFLKMHWNKAVPKGYRRNEDGWIKKDEAWNPIIKDIFHLFIMYKNYKAVANAINTKYASFLSQPLTRQQIASILCDPVYVGRPKYSGKVVNKQFKKVVMNDVNLAYVDEVAFEKAQKIIDTIRQKHARKNGSIIKGIIDKYGIKALDFLRHIKVMCPNCTCPNCKAIMVQNGNPTFNGQKNYICNTCRRQLRVPKKKEMRKIADLASKRRNLSGIASLPKNFLNRKRKSMSKRKVDFGKSTTLENYLF